MKIVFTIPSLTRAGGVLRYVSRTLIGLQKFGHNCAYFSADRSESFELSDKAKPLSDINELREFKPDIIQNNGLIDYPLLLDMTTIAPTVEFVHIYNECPAGGRLNQRNLTPCTFDPSAACFFSMASRRCHPSRNPFRWIHDYQRSRACSNWLKMCNAVCTNSYWTASMISPIRPDAIPVPLSLLDPLESSPYKCNLKTPTFIFSGRPVIDKGLDLLIEASLKLTKKHRLLLHMTNHTNRIKTIAAKYNHIDFSKTMKAGGVLVMPSIFPEPFGLVGIEAFNKGIPVIAFNNGGISEWHPGDSCGKLLQQTSVSALVNAMEIYIDQPDIQSKQSAAAHNHVANTFPPETHINNLISVYRKLISQ